MSLESKVAIVTGGSRGIGRAMCLELAKQGAKVVVNFAGNEAAANEVVENIKSIGGEAISLQADVKSSEQVDKMIKETISTFGGIHILINNAGVTNDNLIMRMKPEQWQDVIDTNLTGVYNCSKAVVKPMMKQRFGRIINITSVVGQVGNQGQVNYSAAKAGVIGFTKSLAKELASRQILVNAVAPGYITTDMTDKLNDEVKAELENQIPLQRLGNPEDVANIVSFLASEKCGYITGQVFNVDGGMVM